MNLLDECWEWNGLCNQDGYGQKKINGTSWQTHRLAFAWATGNWTDNGPKIPDGMLVLHRCDNPPCCNPSHLFLGTHADNVRDAVSKGRHSETRKTHCKHGHQFSGRNLIIDAKGKRKCRECCRLRHAKGRASRASR